jgi:aspartyl/asparaginyl beta-hydroxylase (cupin superfamily)
MYYLSFHRTKQIRSIIHQLGLNTFQFIKQDRGRGTWKFNNTLLSDHDYVSVVKNTIEEVVSLYRINSEDDDGKYFSINDQLLWETRGMVRFVRYTYITVNNKYFQIRTN